MNILNLLSRKRLVDLDKELEKLKYRDLIVGLQELRVDCSVEEKNEDKRDRELRVIYALIDALEALEKVYNKEGD